MEHQKKSKRAKPKRHIKYPRIGDCAEALNVSRTHLWYVLEGIRKGRENLTDDYYRMAKENANER